MSHLMSSRAISPYAVLGVEPGMKRSDIDATYAHLVDVLDEENFMNTPQSWVQAQQAFVAIENAYHRITDGHEPDEEQPAVDASQPLTPKLGQMLVAAGVITMEQLREAVEQQSSLNKPIGEILMNNSGLTQMELDNFLLNQRLIKLPADSPYQLGQRLIGLGLITEDMLRIALVEQRTTEKPLGRILVDRKWLAEDILQALVAYY